MLLSTATNSLSASSGTRIEVLAHRGLWSHAKAGNSLPALQAALRAGYGLETDIRDRDGELVIAHDVPSEPCPLLADLFLAYKSLDSTACLALNIKSCGLAAKLAALLTKFEITNYFVFDMSLPDTLAYQRAGFSFYTRQSEYEREPALYDAAAGVWLDAFHDEWYDRSTITRHLQRGKNVCIVSPELHRRDPNQIWEMLLALEVPAPARLQICTDHPDFSSRIGHGHN